VSASLLAQLVDAARPRIVEGRYVDVFFGDVRFGAQEGFQYGGRVQVRYDLAAVQTITPANAVGRSASLANGTSPLRRVEPCEAIISCQSTDVGATEDDHLDYLTELSDAVADALFGSARAMRLDLVNMQGTFITFGDDPTAIRGLHYRLAFSLIRQVSITKRATAAQPLVAALTTSVNDGLRTATVCDP
jgi:hypothetical protein